MKWVWGSVQCVAGAAVPRYPSRQEIKHVFKGSRPIPGGRQGLRVEVGARDMTRVKKGC